MISMLKAVKRFIAFELETVSGTEKLVSTFGAMIAITLISLISFQFTGVSGAALIVPSMGASAVLLFAVPHGKLSQPWPLFAGNLISALIGIICYQYVSDMFLAAGLAVGLAIGAMHLTSSIHPPGGATALAAVVGGPAIHDLGYNYIITPILLNVTIIFIVAVIFNSLFPWRRYPAKAMMRFTEHHEHSQNKNVTLVEKKHIDQAITDMDLILDVTTEDLQRLMQLTLEHVQHQKLSLQHIKLHHYYTNGKHGLAWSVRCIIDELPSSNAKNDTIIYRVVEGKRFNSTGSCSREEFAEWAAREVFPNEVS